MKTLKINFSFYLALLLLSFSSTAISQELILEIPLKDQVAYATNVVEGEVLNSESFWDEEYKNIYTKHRVKVYKVFKGIVAAEIDVITEGGIVGLQAEVVSNALELKPRDYGIFILNDFSNLGGQQESIPTYKPLSDIQSFYKYSMELNRAANIFKSYDGITQQFYQDILETTGQNVTNVQESPLEANMNLYNTNRENPSAPVINSFSSNNATAGTKTILTINGSGFGTEIATVGFSDANYGGAIFYDVTSSQIVSWNDTSIQVEIPDRAGTGSVKIMNSNNQVGYSSTDLIVDFAQINLDYNNIAYQTQHIDTNNSGGFTWQMNSNFYSSSAADAFNRALETWSCQSGIEWDVSLTTTTASTAMNDDINLVAFDNASPLPPGVLGRCTSRYSGCPFNGEVKWYVEEMDIVFNNSINWNFSTNPPASNETDFESVAVHELGHGQQLGHVINDSEVMHFSISSNSVSRTLSNNDIQGANDVQDRSSNIAICGQPLMDNSNCSTLSTAEESFSSGISIYPNPVSTGILNIKSGQNQFINSITVYNTIGRHVLTKKIMSQNMVNQLDVSTISDGLYLLVIKTDKGVINKKFLVESGL